MATRKKTKRCKPDTGAMTYRCQGFTVFPWNGQFPAHILYQIGWACSKLKGAYNEEWIISLGTRTYIKLQCHQVSTLILQYYNTAKPLVHQVGASIRGFADVFLQDRHVIYLQVKACEQAKILCHHWIGGACNS